MSRIIKFRAWHTVNKVMFAHKDIPVALKNIGDDNIWKYMQYTGIKDSNNNEIYEGDIVRMRINVNAGTPYGEGFSLNGYSQGQVIMHRNGIVLFDFFTWDEDCETIFSAPKKTVKPITSSRSTIIGNIYEHPELLKPYEVQD